MATAFCVRCGSPGEGAFCAECGQARDEALVPAEHGSRTALDVARQAAVNRAKEKHGVPALLSFFLPGLGQLVKGSVLRGIIVFVAMCLAVAAMGIVVGFVIAPILWLWQLYDAYTAPDAATNRELDSLAGKK